MHLPSLRCLPLLLLFLTVFAAASCSKKSAQEQAATEQTDGEEIDPYSNLVFTFDEAVVADAQLNRWDTTQYVKFTPAVRGKFKWTGDRELTFSPLEPFRPSTVFDAALRTENMPSGKDKLELNRRRFHTPYLGMATPQVFYGRSTKAAGTAELRANLVFNYPVRPVDLRPLLRVTQDGKPIAVQLISAEPDKILGLSFTQDVKPGAALTVEVAPGLVPAVGGKATDKPLTAQMDVPEPQILEVRELTGSLVNGEAVVTVLTNQPVAVNDIQTSLKVSPSAPFAIEALESGFALKGSFVVGKTYQVTLASGARGLLGGQLYEPYSQSVSFAAERPSISFASGEKAMYLDALGTRNLGLRINEVQKVKVTIAKVYANNIQQLLRGEPSYGYPGYDGEESEFDEGSNRDEDGEYIDRSFRYYDTENIGNVISERTISVTGLPKSGGLRLLNLDLKELEFQG
ncbi:MAG TPA: hypothetical protein VF630_05795, partial [Hymenobacter sp.]